MTGPLLPNGIFANYNSVTVRNEFDILQESDER